MRVLPAGDGAILLEFESAQQVASALHDLKTLPRETVIELVPAARTILVEFDPARTSPTKIAAAVGSGHDEPPSSANAGSEVTIPVVYDGPDLADFAAATGMSVADVIQRHAAGNYRVAFCGFAPGFAYMTGLDQALELPRRATPRTRVPAGSVAVADEFSAVYPSASPGGWHLLGRTDAALWDVERDPPALLSPGTRVRFRPVSAIGAGS